MKYKSTRVTGVTKLTIVRRWARKHNMTFKRQHDYINGKACYMLTNRTTGDVIQRDFTIASAYDALPMTALPVDK